MNLIDEYVNCAIQIEQINIGGIKKENVKKNNKLAKRLRELACAIESEKPELKEDFAKLLHHENQYVRIWCAHHILENMVYSDDVRNIAINIISLRAKEDYGEKLWLDRWNSI